MATLPPVANVLRMQFKHTYGADTDVLNRLYFQWAGTAPTNTALSAIASTIGTAWGTNLKARAISTVTLTEIILEDLTSSSGALGSASPNIAGTNGGGTLPLGVCALVNFGIQRRYRGGKPRVYLPYGTESDLSNGRAWNSTFLTNMLTNWNSWITAILAASSGGTTISEQVNVSYYSGFTVYNPGGGKRAKNIPTLRASPIVDAIATTSVNTVPANQRRRLGKR